MNTMYDAVMKMEQLLGVYERLIDDLAGYMKENGNASQWDDSYPDRATLERDIAGGNSYVFVDGLALVAFDCIART